MKETNSKPIKVLHIAAEYYPAAKVGGLGDVVGTLPKYLQGLDMDVHVIIPKYHLPWFFEHEFEEQYRGHFWNPTESIYYTIDRFEDQSSGFQIYTVDIPGKFDRHGVYSDEFGWFGDEAERWLAFQRSALDWLMSWAYKPDIIHCHDHHTSMIPFMMKFCFKYSGLSKIPTVFTIHNERYQGAFQWSQQFLLPRFDNWKSGLLDWNNWINPFASAVRCADRVTTVSPSHMHELKSNSFGLENLFYQEDYKCIGLLNGIDYEVWNPKKDEHIYVPLKRSKLKFKKENKSKLCTDFNLNPELPLISFIGRMVHEKGTDELVLAIYNLLQQELNYSFIILGTGDKNLEHSVLSLHNLFPENVGITLSYNEGLAHKIYAGTDFLIMPSRIEPCGLNQMYAMRYGAVPIVHRVGGLIDTVTHHKEEDGTGILFEGVSSNIISSAIQYARQLFQDKKEMEKIIENGMRHNFSWEHSAKAYKSLYEELI